MAIIYFPSPDNCDVVEIELLNPKGGSVFASLFVDSGFTGESCLVMSEFARQFAIANISAAHTSGALQGRQPRILITCRISALDFQSNLIAIVTDVSSLALPDGVVGMAGLSFLRLFARWGAQRSVDGSWQFFLTKGED